MIDHQGQVQIHDTEDALLGSVILEPRYAAGAARITCGAEFSDAARGRMFDEIVTAQMAGEPTGDPTWLRNLTSRGCAQSVCNPQNIARLFTFTHDPHNYVYYATQVRRRFLAGQLAIALGNASLEAQDPKSDPSQVRAGIEAKLASIGVGEVDDAKPIGEVMKSAAARMGEERDNRLRVFTGIGDLDNAMGPMCAGEMVVIAARPGQGKTALALQIAWHNAERKRPALFVSLEMTSEELALRKLSALAEVDSRVIRNGRVCPQQLSDIAEIAGAIDLPLYLWAPARATMAQIRGVAKGLTVRHPLQVVVIDYIGLIKHEGQAKFTPRHEQVAAISNECKRLAKELECPVLVLCQLNREADNQKPSLANLRDSGAIEQDADIVIFPYRDQSSKQPEDEEGGIEASVILGKHRHGAPGEVAARWIASRTCFANRYRSEVPLFNAYNRQAEELDREERAREWRP